MATVFGQSTELPLGNDAYHILDRQEIKAGKDFQAPFFSTFKPYKRKDVTQFMINLDEAGVDSSNLNHKDRVYIFKDNNDWIDQPAEGLDGQVFSDKKHYEKVYVDSSKVFYTYRETERSSNPTLKRYYSSKKPIFKVFYKTPANLWEINKPAFKMRVNPIIHFKLGKEQEDEGGYTFLNTRGVDVRGSIDDRVWFHTRILENQARFPIHVTERNIATSSVPGAGFYKRYESRVFDITNGYDYLLATGYVNARISKHIHVQLGHGQNFIGNGHRSLFLSDYSTNYFYLKLNTKVWKFNYQNIFAELTSQFDRDTLGDVTRPKKYIAAHHLSINILPNLNIGLFESVVFDRGNTFELQYLNPVILYRTVEQAVGSPDNANIGLDFKYNFLKRFSLYGQIMIDEFVFNELVVERRGWWANKIAYQLGLKYIDVIGIDHLDLQLEYNSVRPFTYTHRDESANYTHYNQPLAHPLGANFKEIIAILRYQPIFPLKLQGRLVYANFGTDIEDSNWGSNIFLNHLERSAPDGTDDEIGHRIGQGIGNKLLILDFNAAYQLKHNLYLDFNAVMRNLESDDDSRDYSRIFVGFGVRWNIADRIVDY
ncbi:MAG: capsule assembly Wzi family protein [Bacteroidota bacterium]